MFGRGASAAERRPAMKRPSAQGRNDFILPSSFLQHIADNPIMGDDGQELEPEVYTINSDIRKFWDHLPAWQHGASFFWKVFTATLAMASDG